MMHFCEFNLTRPVARPVATDNCHEKPRLAGGRTHPRESTDLRFRSSFIWSRTGGQS